MRTATEGLRLAVAAAHLWRERAVQLATVFALGFGLHLLGLQLSVRLGPSHQIAATLVFVLAVLARVGALVVMLWLCRPAGDTESLLDVAAMAIGPFLAVYALWGLVEDEVYGLFAANIAVSGLGGFDEWSINLQWIEFYLVLALAAWVLRQVVGLLASRRPSRPMLLVGVLLEGVWTFASALALLAGLGRLIEWITSRALWQGALGLWHAFLDALPDLRLPFDLTLPEALHELASWLIGTVLPGVWTAVLLPLVWLALATVVFGWRNLNARTVVAGTALATAHRRLTDGWSGYPWRRLLHRLGLLLTGDLRTKYLPIVHAFRLLWSAGPPFLAAYLVAATVLETARTWAALALTWLLGPREPYVALTWSWAENLGVGLVFTTAAVALYAAAAHRVLDTESATVTGVGAPAAAGPSHRRAGPEP